MSSAPKKKSNAAVAAATAVVVAGLVYGSPKLVEFIGKWEDGGPKVTHTVYADKIARGLPTGCRGITKHVADEPVIVGDVWSAEKCDRMTKAALTKVQLQLRPCFKREPPQSVFDMGTSHAWNFGAPKTCASAAMAAWNRGDWELGCRRLLLGDDGRIVWSYSEGKFYRGLAFRRADEMAHCMIDVR